jgi:carboxypeptidase Q
MTTFAGTFLRWSTTAALMAAVVSTVCLSASAQDRKKHEEAKAVPSYYGPQPATETLDLGMYQRIREEGFQHGKVMDFAEALNDGIGPRLTGSPNMAKANAWTRDTLTAIGLSNAHLEDWGEFGFGWQQVNTWARMVSPDPEPLWMQSSPWSPATKGPVSGEIVYVPLTDAKELDALKGKLAGKIVLLGATRPTPDITKPLFTRYTDEELKEMQTYEAGRSFSLSNPAFRTMYAQRMQTAALRKQALAMMADEGVLAIITRAAIARMAAVLASSSTITARTSRAMRRSRRTPSRFLML